MSTPTSGAADEKTPSMELSVEAELSKLVKQESPKLSTAMDGNAERIRSSIARLTTNSIDELQGLITELQKMQEFLKSEVDSVQRQIESALAGINIIVETIGPWKGTAISSASQGSSARTARPGPAIDPAPSRRISAAS